MILKNLKFILKFKNLSIKLITKLTVTAYVQTFKNKNNKQKIFKK
jgi:hypothetical protein